MIEAQMLLARIVQRFRLELASSVRVDPEPVVTLRPRGGLRMRLRRQTSTS
jgi:cytochrome P450